MNNTLKLLFSKTKVYTILFLCTVCMMATCKTNTDPNLVFPSARLQITAGKPSNSIIDIVYDGITKPAVPAMMQVRPEDVVISATGMQLDRNIRRVKVTLRHKDARCVEYSGANSSGSFTKTQPGVIEKWDNAPEGGAAMWVVKYNLKEYAAQFQCASGTVEVEMEVIVTVYNVAGKITEMPPVKLKMMYSASDYKL